VSVVGEQQQQHCGVSQMFYFCVIFISPTKTTIRSLIKSLKKIMYSSCYSLSSTSSCRRKVRRRRRQIERGCGSDDCAAAASQAWFFKYQQCLENNRMLLQNFNMVNQVNISYAELITRLTKLVENLKPLVPEQAFSAALEKSSAASAV
jgi:hypothetical protein